MTLDRRHLAVALSLLAGGIAYNAWAFAKPHAGTPAAAAVLAADSSPAPATRGGGGLAASHPGAAPSGRSEPAADVMIDSPPVWSRDPFMRRGPAPAAVAAAPAEPLPAPPDPDVVVNSILYSPARRLAMVNGRTVRVGQKVGGVQVVDILPDAVVVEFPSGEVRTIERRSAAAARGRK